MERFAFCHLFSPTLYFPFSTMKRLQKEIVGSTQFKLAETEVKLKPECLVISSKMNQIFLGACLNYLMKRCP